MSNKSYIWKWIYRIICAVGAITIALLAIVLDSIDKNELYLCLASIGVLSWQGSIPHSSENDPIKKKRSLIKWMKKK